ncbi:MAG: hypothetical protein ACE5Q6_08210 [Dehalococcoidia bacterium]
MKLSIGAILALLWATDTYAECAGHTKVVALTPGTQVFCLPPEQLPTEWEVLVGSQVFRFTSPDENLTYQATLTTEPIWVRGRWQNTQQWGPFLSIPAGVIPPFDNDGDGMIGGPDFNQFRRIWNTQMVEKAYLPK